MAAAQQTSTAPTATASPSASGPDDDRRSAKWHRRRQEVIDRSAELFAERGFHATSTADLCEANALGKGALYYYIGSKEELLTAIIDRVMDDVLAGAERAVTSGGSPGERLRELGREYLNVIFHHPDHVRVFLHEFTAVTGDSAATLRARRRSFEEIVEEVLTDGAASGAFAVPDARLTARAWLGTHNYTYLWLRPGGDLSARDVADHFAEVFLKGIER